MRHWLLCITCTLLLSAGSAQEWLRPADTLQPQRLWGVAGGVSATYGASMLVISEYWYRGYERGPFRWFDDSREWLQMDKAGHVFNGYFLSRWLSGMCRWSGLPAKKSAIIGSAAGFVMLSSIEWLDGYSVKWGASSSDLLANAIGSGLHLGQALLWGEQRMSLKISAFPQSYPQALTPRTNALYGNTVAELVLKDYNALTVWLSANVHQFLPGDSRWPKWLNVAVGYGADGLYGGFENRWCATSGLGVEACPESQIVDRTDIPRLRQYYLSLDVDFSRIHSRKPWVRTLLEVANLIKVPAPALMINSKGRVRFYPVYF